MSDRTVRLSGRPKLRGPEDFQTCRYVARVCIEDGDPNLVGLTPRPEEGTPAATMRKWAEANAKARRVIVCALGIDPLTRFGGMLADCTAKELWDELARAYSTSNAQAIINLERQLKELSFDDKGDWQKQINSFHELTGKLASHGSVLTSDQKKFKLMRTLPDSLAPIAMIANTTQMDFDGMVDSVQAELARRRASSSRAGPSNPSAAAAQAPRDMNLGMQRGVNKKKNRACWICHRRGHYANECFYRTRGDDSGGRGRGNGRGRGRGRGGRGRSRGMYRGGFQGGQYFTSYQNHQGRLRMVRLCNTVRTLLQTSHNSHNMAIRKHLRQTCITLVSLRHRQRCIKVKEVVEPDRPVRKLRLASMVSWRR